MQTFRTRALTSLVFVAVMLGGILINKWTFLALFSVIHFGCWFEYQKLVNNIDPAYKSINTLHKYAVMFTGWGYMLWMTTAIYNIQGYRLEEIGQWLCISMGAATLMAAVLNKPFNLRLISHSIFGLLYISLSLGLLVNIYCKGIISGADFGWIIILILIAILWINDTMAYLVGSFIGKTPLSPISPKKTWEGTIGGVVLAVVAVTLACHYIFEGFDYRFILILSTTVAVTGIMGDLLESKLKRLAGVKDTGNIMPGHGGFLDRFDSLLLATPFAWLLIYFSEQLG